MKELGLFGLNIPEEYGGNPVDYTTFAVIFEELSRGWMALAGIIGTHLVLADVLVRYGTDEQKRRFLPRLATGEPRGGICLSEPNAGTDLQAISTVALPRRRHLPRDRFQDVGHQRPLRAGVPAAGEDRPRASPPHRGMSAFVIEKGAPGLTVGRDIDKLGYKTVETTELHFDDFPVPAGTT